MGRVPEGEYRCTESVREQVMASSTFGDSRFCSLPPFCCIEQERMRKLMVLPMLVLLITRPLVTLADFHVVNMYYGFDDDIGLDYQMVIPSTQWGCGGVPTNTIAGGRYPDCHGGYDLHLPNNTCDYSGVTIRPACRGGYFGKLHDQQGGDIGDCFWHDAGEVSAFTCTLNVSNSNYQIIYDRLLCSTNMCGS